MMRPDAAPAKTLKIALAGDVMCGDSFYAVGHGVSSSLDRHGEDFLSKAIVDFFHRHDAVLFNMESVLSDTGRKEHSLRRLHMRGRPETATRLAQWGMTCANVANNHILEQGRICAADTVRHLNAADIRTVGAGRDGSFQPSVQTAEWEIKGQTLVVLGICLLDEKYAYGGGLSVDRLTDEVKSLAAADRVVIVSIHWGQELVDRPTTRQKEIAARLLEAGVSVIVGHHPHVVQGVQHSANRLVAYSLGNFIFDSFLPDCRWSMVLTVELSGRDVVGWSYVPIVKDDEHRPRFAEGQARTELEAEIERRCRLLKDQQDTQQYQQAYQQDFAKADATARRQLRLNLLTTLPRKKLIFWPQLLLRPIQRRLGRW